MGFGLDDKQRAKLEAWMQEQDKKVMEEQKGTKLEHPGEAYYGACGGAYTYSFTPISIGLVTKVKNECTGDVIDLTDYEDW